MHYAQNKATKRFALYTYALEDKNFERYGQAIAPTVNLTNIKSDIPIAMFVANQDEVSSI